MVKVLLLEDDFTLASEVKRFLDSRECPCDVVYDGLLFVRQTRIQAYNAYILDINVPSLNGFEVCRQIRQTDKTTPILMLTAFGDVNDKVEALGLGADDYLVKPFHFEELHARLRALLRRGTQPQALDDLCIVADLKIDFAVMTVMRGSKKIDLTPKEYKLLELLARAGGRPVSKTTISEQVWDMNFDTGTNTIEVYISFLRNKIDKDFPTKLLHTRPGFGYYLKEMP